MSTPMNTNETISIEHGTKNVDSKSHKSLVGSLCWKLVAQEWILKNIKYQVLSMIFQK